MRLTVAICTWNRASLLRQTLGSLAELVVPPVVEWELLVVNNNSTDATEQVIASWAGRLPIRALWEPRQGKSHALNLAVGMASGDYVLFTDDDVLVEPAWLLAYYEAFCAHPDAAVFGGPIAPWFSGEPPAWLVRTFHQIEYAFAALDLGDTPVPFGGHDVPFGANMAMRMQEHRGHRYDPDLGPRPGNGLRGEEITLVKKVLAEGARGWWVPGAKVRHYIPADRQTVSHVRHWYRGWGNFLARTEPRPPDTMLLNRPLWLWRELIEAEVRYRVARVLAKPEVWVEALKRTGTAQGQFANYRRP